MDIIMSETIILVDMDGVLANFDKAVIAILRQEYPEIPVVEPSDRKSFYLADDYPDEYRETIESIYVRPGFYKNLPPFSGAIDAVNLMDNMGFNVFICTSPLTEYKNCVGEKYEWVHTHLGDKFVKRVILTKDKTLVRGTILIDDKPHITGGLIPEWKHVIFDAPYNRHANGFHRITWGNWQDILLRR